MSQHTRTRKSSIRMGTMSEYCWPPGLRVALGIPAPQSPTNSAWWGCSTKPLEAPPACILPEEMATSPTTSAELLLLHQCPTCWQDGAWPSNTSLNPGPPVRRWVTFRWLMNPLWACFLVGVMELLVLPSCWSWQYLKIPPPSTPPYTRNPARLSPPPAPTVKTLSLVTPTGAWPVGVEDTLRLLESQGAASWSLGHPSVRAENEARAPAAAWHPPCWDHLPLALMTPTNPSVVGQLGEAWGRKQQVKGCLSRRALGFPLLVGWPKLSALVRRPPCPASGRAL